MKSEMLEFLKQYIHETPKETIKSEWAEIQQQTEGGVKASSYAAFLDFKYSCDYIDPCLANIIFEENMTPKYSGSSFLRNIVV